MIYFLMAAFNEEKNVSKIAVDIEKQFNGIEYKVIFVNDGSTDNTLNILQSLTIPKTIINHEVNKGLGNALRTGFGHVFNIIKESDILITLDADNSHPIEKAKELSEILLKNNNLDIIIASRYAINGKEIGLRSHRKIFSKTINILLSILYPYKNIKDYTTGFRAYRGSILLKLSKKYMADFIKAEGFTAGVELLLKSLVLKQNVIEIPLILRYDLKVGKSKIKILRTIYEYFVLFITVK